MRHPDSDSVRKYKLKLINEQMAVLGKSTEKLIPVMDKYAKTLKSVKNKS